MIIMKYVYVYSLSLLINSRTTPTTIVLHLSIEIFLYFWGGQFCAMMSSGSLWLAPEYSALIGWSGLVPKSIYNVNMCPSSWVPIFLDDQHKWFAVPVLRHLVLVPVSLCGYQQYWYQPNPSICWVMLLETPEVYN